MYDARDIVFLGGQRTIRQIVGYDTNRNTKKVALFLSNPNRPGKIETTKYVFEFNDFDPPFDDVNWSTYWGVFACWKDINGMHSCIPEVMKGLHRRYTVAQQEIEMERRITTETLEDKRIKMSAGKQDDEVFRNASMLDKIKKLSNDTPDLQVTKKQGFGDLMKQ